MYKEEFPYTNFEGETVVEEVYFNLTKMELAENLDLREEFLALQTKLQGDKRELTEPEIMEVLALLKRLVRLSYGKKDGKKFLKTDEAFAEFQGSGAHDEFMYSFFKDPEKLLKFLNATFPQDLLEEAQKQADEKTHTIDELIEMSQEEFDRVAGTDPTKWSKEQMLAAFKRKSAA